MRYRERSSALAWHRRRCRAGTAPASDTGHRDRGEAVVRRAPDRAFVTVSVETRAKNPRDAQRQNAEAMTAVQQRLTQARIAEGADPHDRLRPEQEFDFVQGRRVPREFVARNWYRSPCRRHRPHRRGGRRGRAVGRDVGQRYSIRPPGARDGGARGAAARGGGRAGACRRGRGRRGAYRRPRPADRGLARRRHPAAAADDDDARAAEAPQTPIEPGLIEIRARVTLTASMR